MKLNDFTLTALKKSKELSNECKITTASDNGEGILYTLAFEYDKTTLYFWINITEEEPISPAKIEQKVQEVIKVYESILQDPTRINKQWYLNTSATRVFAEDFKNKNHSRDYLSKINQIIKHLAQENEDFKTMYNKFISQETREKIFSN